MKEIIEIQKIIAPETIEIIKKRHNILRSIGHLQPIGRRALATQLRIGERILRTDVEFLKEQGLVDVTATGMSMTQNGWRLLASMTEYVKELLGLKHIEEQLELRLGIGQVIIVPGDSSKDPLIKEEIGKASAKALQRIVSNGDIVAITGGSTIATIPRNLPKLNKDVLVVPGRGALGEQVEIQANTIVAALASQLGGTYKMLNVPDNISSETIEKLYEDTSIKEAITAIKKANILIHGIGDAVEMAQRRGCDTERIQYLTGKEAVAEAFGYYFERDGKIVYHSNSVGIKFTDLEKIPVIIAIAGGSNKARAIKAVALNHHQHILITDEGAALELMKIC